jgi:hypothetical protein
LPDAIAECQADPRLNFCSPSFYPRAKPALIPTIRFLAGFLAFLDGIGIGDHSSGHLGVTGGEIEVVARGSRHPGLAKQKLNLRIYAHGQLKTALWTPLRWCKSYTSHSLSCHLRITMSRSCRPVRKTAMFCRGRYGNSFRTPLRGPRNLDPYSSANRDISPFSSLSQISCRKGPLG